MPVVSRPHASAYRCHECGGVTTIVVEAETRRSNELLSVPDVAYRVEHSAHGRPSYKYEVVQCKRCRAEALIMRGARPDHWRKTSGWWTNIDERLERTDVREREEREREQFWITRPWKKVNYLKNLTSRKVIEPSWQFEICIADFLGRSGYDVERVGRPGDEGIDIFASKNTYTIALQCKHWKTRVGSGPVRDFTAALIVKPQFERGIIVSLAGFTKPAVDFADRLVTKRVLLIASVGLNLMFVDLNRFEKDYLFKFDIEKALVDPAPVLAANKETVHKEKGRS